LLALVVVLAKEPQVHRHVDFRHLRLPPAYHTGDIYLNKGGYLNGLRKIDG
jgi:hypothetical protein